MKKFLALVLSVVMVASLAACGNSGTKETQAPAASGDSATATESTAAESTGETAEKVGDGVDAKDLKVGFIFIGDENEGYTAAHYAGAKGMQEALGLSDDQVIIKRKLRHLPHQVTVRQQLSQQQQNQQVRQQRRLETVLMLRI